MYAGCSPFLSRASSRGGIGCLALFGLVLALRVVVESGEAFRCIGVESEASYFKGLLPRRVAVCADDPEAWGRPHPRGPRISRAASSQTITVVNVLRGFTGSVNPFQGGIPRRACLKSVIESRFTPEPRLPVKVGHYGSFLRFTPMGRAAGFPGWAAAFSLSRSKIRR
jgi:hypothetical protein